MKKTWILALAFPISLAWAGGPSKTQLVRPNRLTFSGYVRENYQILAKRKRDLHQVAFEAQARKPADVPDPAPIKSFSLGNSSGKGGGSGAGGFGAGAGAGGGYPSSGGSSNSSNPQNSTTPQQSPTEQSPTPPIIPPPPPSENMAQ